ncbi:MAG TPA: dihydrolipoyl dehydrogenase [Candidatus Omnitrophota bacterium]|nr:dihydrolipoyl dehydrogenase [Candidatus Omnitrophota bacterium]HPS36775.1 dihydrolipoyl dehydrogenase [Candidatus Omnitrophota bacterium]
MENLKTDIVVIGGGPGGYTAAFYAAARGKRVVLIEKDASLGGVCLNRGCIPSKALLHIAGLIHETRDAEKWGIEYASPTLHLSRIREWKTSVVSKLTQGLSGLAARRNVQILRGQAEFESSGILRVGEQRVEFANAIIATGSVPAVPGIFDVKDKRVMTSTEALELEEIPPSLLIIGGGYIGMELGTVYSALGSKVVVAEALAGILTGADADLVRFVRERAVKFFREIRVGAKVLEMKPEANGIRVVMESGGEKKEELFDRVLVSTGRRPVTQGLGFERTKVQVNEKGFIQVDTEQRTADPRIYAVGDVAGGMLLAHKASRDARVAVDAILEEKEGKIPVMPAVVFTDPEIAWCGLTENEAKDRNMAVQVVKFPWTASGRATTLDRTDGVTKLILDPKSEKVLGVGLCGAGAGELIGEGVLAIEMGAKAKDLENTVHPHPTLSETLKECAEMFYGVSASAYSRKRG